MKYWIFAIVLLGLVVAGLVGCSQSCERAKTSIDRSSSQLLNGYYESVMRESGYSWSMQVGGDSIVLFIEKGDSTWELVFDKPNPDDKNVINTKAEQCN